MCFALWLALYGSYSPSVLARQSQVIPRDTPVKLVLKNELSTKNTEVGEKFTAIVAEDVLVDGRILLRHGATVKGTVTEVERAKRLAGLQGKAKMTLRFDTVQTRYGERPILAHLVSVHDPVPGVTDQVTKDDDRDVNEEGEIKAETDTKDIITKGAIGVAAGAVLGALFGNVSRGLILGSVGGAIAILAPKGKDVTLKEGTGLEVRLDRDLSIAAT